MEYPTILYRCPGAIKKTSGQHVNATYDVAGAQNPIEYQLLQAKGWHDTFDAAYEAQQNRKNAALTPVVTPAALEEPLPSEREQLEIEAKALGIKFDGRTGNAKLAFAIQQAKGA
jgi:hypothetical protein